MQAYPTLPYLSYLLLLLGDNSPVLSDQYLWLKYSYYNNCYTNHVQFRLSPFVLLSHTVTYGLDQSSTDDKKRLLNQEKRALACTISKTYPWTRPPSYAVAEMVPTLGLSTSVQPFTQCPFPAMNHSPDRPRSITVPAMATSSEQDAALPLLQALNAATTC